MLPVDSIIAHEVNHRKRSRKNCIAVHKTSEGFGMNYQTRMDAVGIADLHGMWYCHMDVTKITHHVDSEEADRIMGFPTPVSGCSGCQIIVHHVKNLGNPYSAQILTLPVKDELRKIYNRGDRTVPPECRYDSAKENVAVHIRRGDIAKLGAAGPEGNHGTLHWVANSVYISQMAQLRLVNKEYGQPKALLFHIFSEGNADDFKGFLGDHKDVVLHIDEDALLSFRCMVAADRLVEGSSSFSQTAGVVSLGLVYKLDRENVYNTNLVNHEQYYAAGMRNIIGHAPLLVQRNNTGKKYKKRMTAKSQTMRVRIVNSVGGGDVTNYIQSTYMPALGMPADKLGLVVTALRITQLVKQVMQEEACSKFASRLQTGRCAEFSIADYITAIYLPSLEMSPEGVGKCSAAIMAPLPRNAGERANGISSSLGRSSHSVPSASDCHPAFVALLRHVMEWATSTK